MRKQVAILKPNERLELHNLMLMLALEEEKISKYNLLLDYAGKSLNGIRKDISKWTENYAKLLKEESIDIQNVEINPESGAVTLVEDINHDNTCRCGKSRC